MNAAPEPTSNTSTWRTANKIWTTVIGTILLLAIGLLTNHISHNHNIELYGNKIQQNLQRYQKEIIALREAQAFFAALLPEPNKIEKEWIDSFYNKPYSLFVYDSDSSLIYWNNNLIDDFNEPLAHKNSITTKLLGDRLTSVFHQNDIRVKDSTGIERTLSIIAILPIYNKYSKQINSALLPSHESDFVSVEIIDETKIQLAKDPTVLPLISRNKAKLLKDTVIYTIKAIELDTEIEAVDILALKANPNAAHPLWAFVSNMFYVLGLVGIGLCFYKGSVALFEEKGKFWTALLLLMASLGTEYLYFYFIEDTVAEVLQDVFSEDHIKTGLALKLFYFVLEVYLYTLVSYFIYWHLSACQMPKFLSRAPILIVGAVILMIALEVIYVMATIGALLNPKQQFLVFYNLAHISFNDLVLNASFMFFFIASTLKNAKILITLPLNRDIWKEATILLIIGALVVGMIAYKTWEILPIAFIAPMVMIILFAFSYNLSRKTVVNLFYITMQIIIFTLFSALTFFYFIDHNKEKYIRETLEIISRERDLNIEVELNHIGEGIRQDAKVIMYYETLADTSANSTYSTHRISRLISEEYLYDRLMGKYEYSLSFYDANRRPMKYEKRPIEFYTIMLSNPQAIRIDAEETAGVEIYFIRDSIGTHTYLLQIEVNSDITNTLGYIIVEMKPTSKDINMNFIHAFFGVEHNYLEKFIDKSEIAFYKDSVLVWSVNKNILPSKLEKYTKEGKDLVTVPISRLHKEQDYYGKKIMVYHNAENSENDAATYGNVVVIVKENMQWIEVINISIFIFCATLLTIFAVFLVLAAIYRFKPFRLFLWSYKHSLDAQIQFLIIGVLLVMLVGIGYTTITSLDKEYEMRNESYLATQLLKVAELLEESNHIRQLFINPIPDFSPDKLNDSMELEINMDKIQEITKLPFHIYDENGLLMGSTIELVFDKNWISTKINPQALYALRSQRRPHFIIEESIGSYRYLSLYVRIQKGNKSMYFNFVYDKNTQDIEDIKRREDFLSSLLHTYAAILVFACLVAFLIAHSMTNTLRKISEHLKKVSLDKKNEPITNVRLSSEEIEEIVQRYNQMISDLEDKKVKLEQTQRETAWRDMAKQVAHEIKNPLTPMKLKMQMLEHLVRRDPEKAIAKFENVSKGIIEQIDNLAAIASEFSNFAQMPPPENEVFEINALAHSTLQIFEHHEEYDIHFQPSTQHIQVYADKKQVLRVFNNLIKNATQAIPEERKGHITVSIEHAQDRVFIRVADNGIGISEEVKIKIFSPYFTSKSSGTGIGLYMCKNIIMNAHGAIYFESEVDKGTTFTVELPIYKA